MITLLAKYFIKDREAYQDPATRQSYGMLCSGVGIFLNICLFAGKFAAGLLARSIAITADAFNNLSDAGSSVITLIGFQMAGQKPDPDHPFGHGRIEYISGLLVSILILLMGAELVKTSADKLLHKDPAPGGTGFLPPGAGHPGSLHPGKVLYVPLQQKTGEEAGLCCHAGHSHRFLQ